jgi:aspartate/methionine/tyrosine aminotransferase
MKTSSTRGNAGSDYMRWAKLHSTARFNLATSGIAALPLSELGVSLEDLEINGENAYGYEPLLTAISVRYRVPRELIVSAPGTSFANYLALAAATEPGDEVLIEQPTYNPLLSVARYLGLRIKRFRRHAEHGFAIDLEDLERRLTSQTRVVVLCNLHNPSGALTPDPSLKEIARLAGKTGAYVIVDEVYREMLFEVEPRTSFHIDPERFVITNSLTKAYGLSGLRCGWVLAPAHLAERMWRIHDLHAGTNVYPAELLSVAAFSRLQKIAARAKSLLDNNRVMLRDFLRGRDDLECFWPDYGTVVFPRLKSGSIDELCDFLRTEFDTSVVPGRFFECPDRFRIGVGISSSEVRESLDRLQLGLAGFRSLSSTGSRR